MMQQNSIEWLEWRKSKIGSSDAPIIMEESPWSTPYQLWEMKLNIATPRCDSPAMARGREMEQSARSAFEMEKGVDVFPQILESKKNSYMIASLDGIDFEGKIAVEIKCPGAADQSLALKGLIPTKYIPQLMHQLYVAELDKMYYYSFDGVEGVTIEVGRDEEYIKKLLEKEERFYEHMIKKEPPPLTDKDYQYRVDEEWKKKEEAWLEANNALKIAKDNEKKARESLLDGLSTNTKGDLVKATRYFMKGRVDYGKIPELLGVDLEEYRSKEIECWRPSPIK